MRALLAALLLVTTAQAQTIELDISVDGVSYEPIAPVVEKPDHGPIYTANMSGVTFGERLQAAYDLAPKWKGQRKVVWETGWQETADTIDRPSLDGLVDEATYTVLFWADSVPDTCRKPMLRMRAGSRISLKGAYLKGRRIGTQEDVAGDCGIEIVPDYENNKNTARHLRISQCRFGLFERGAILGCYSSPDITGVVFSECLFSQCKTGFEGIGGNAIVKLNNCDWTGTRMQYAIRTVYSAPRHFDETEPRFVDLWGNEKPFDWTWTKRWRERLLDAQGRSGTNPEFDSSTARTWGGGLDLVCTDAEMSFGRNDNLDGRFAICSEGNKFELVRTRIEGKAGAAKINSIYRNPNMHAKRFDCLIEDVHVVHAVKPFEVERKAHNAGFAMRIVRGYYANPDLPEESSDLSKGLVVWDKPRGPQGIIKGER